MKVKDLKSNYHVFGNKGNVWSNNAHIAQSGFFSTTLCGVPMLSSNWARIEELEEANCPECNKIYNESLEVPEIRNSDFFTFKLTDYWGEYLSPMFSMAECEWGIDRDDDDTYSWVFRIGNEPYVWNLTINKITLKINLV